MQSKSSSNKTGSDRSESARAQESKSDESRRTDGTGWQGRPSDSSGGARRGGRGGARRGRGGRGGRGGANSGSRQDDKPLCTVSGCDKVGRQCWVHEVLRCWKHKCCMARCLLGNDCQEQGTYCSKCDTRHCETHQCYVSDLSDAEIKLAKEHPELKAQILEQHQNSDAVDEAATNAILDAYGIKVGANKPEQVKVPSRRDEIDGRANSSQIDEFEVYVRAHFIAFGYTEKSFKDALSSLMKWRHITKTNLNITEMRAVIVNHYTHRTDRLTWLERFNIWRCRLVDLVENRYLQLASLGLLTTAAYFKRSKFVATTALVTGGMFAYFNMHKMHKRNITVDKQPVLRTYCTGVDLTKIPDIDIRANVTMPSVVTCKCVPTYVPVGFSFGVRYAWVPRNCIHNELNALTTRQLQLRIPVTPQGVSALVEGKNRISSFFTSVSPSLSKDEMIAAFLQKYPLSRRAQIQKAMVNDIVVDTRVSGFCKVETMVGKPVSKRKVRFISGFSDGYLGETGPEYYIFQKEMCKKYWSDSVERARAKFLYTGGLLADEIGDWFQDKFDRGMTLLLLDYSKFDSRNKAAVLAGLYSFYKERLSEELYKWLLDTFHKHGRTKLGIKFNVEATVASGRIDTSLGNTFIVFMLCVAVLGILDSKYVDEMEVSALGDDNNIAVNEFRHSLEQLKAAAVHVGHEVDGLIITPSDYWNAEYCSQRVWQINSRESVLGPKIGRMLAKTFICHKHVPADKLEAHIGGVMLGFKAYRWLPVFSAVYNRWFELHPKGAKLYYAEDNQYKTQLKRELDVDTDLVYQQFQQVYGFDAIALEQEISKLDFKMGDTYSSALIDKLLEVDGVSYDYQADDFAEWLSQKSLVLGTWAQ